MQLDQLEGVIIDNLLTNKEYCHKVLKIISKHSKYFNKKFIPIIEIIEEHNNKYNQHCSYDDVQLYLTNKTSNEKHKIDNTLSEIKQIDYSLTLDKLLDVTITTIKDKMYWEALEVGSKGLVDKDEHLKSQAEKILDERERVSLDTDVGIEFADKSIIEYYTKDKMGVQTQHPSLNSRINGFLPGTLSIFLASAGIGKSLLLTDLATGFIQQKLNVLILSLEMSSYEVMSRVHSNFMNIDISSLRPNRFKDIKEQFRDGLRRERGKLWVKDTSEMSSYQLDALLDTFKREKDIKFDVVIVDYLGIMKSNRVSPNVGLYTYIKSIAEELRAVAMKHQIPILTASQLNRSAVNNTSADNSAISDSFGTAMTADFMMFLLQTDEMKQQGEILCRITKNRFTGKTDSFPLKVDYTKMRIVDTNVDERIVHQMETQTQHLIQEDNTANHNIANNIDKTHKYSIDDILAMEF